MASLRDVRKALARGNADEALMLAWNTLEPLRLRGDVGGLRTVGQVAQHIAEHGDGSQAREAQRLLEEVRETLDAGRSDEPRASFGPAEPVVVEAPRGAGAPRRPQATEVETGEPDLEEPIPDGPILDGPAPDEEAPGPRIPPLVWAAIIAAFVIFNVVSGLLRE